MTTYVVPKTLPRRAQELLNIAMQLTDESGAVWPTGDPPSAMTTLTNATHKTKQAIHPALRDLERAGLAHRYLVVHRGKQGKGGLRVVLNVSGTPWVAGLCATCGHPTNGTGRWCATHKQTEGRHDRRWQIAAEVLLEAGHDPQRIALLLKKPCLVAWQDDGRTAQGGAVVPYLLGQGLLGPEWSERLRAAAMGNEEA